jgi:heme exporter protein A
VDESRAAPPGLAIEVVGVTKSFGQHVALQGVSLTVKKGESLVIFGPNGAGKTTLIRVLATLINPDSGRILINGLDLKEDATEVKKKIGVVTHQTLLYDNLTAYENLRFYGRMFDVPDLEDRIREVAEQVGLQARLKDKVRTFSHGLQQRLSIARAIIHRPSILLLDEPETGLDQKALTLIQEDLLSLPSGERSIVMTTHNLERGLAMGDRAIILLKGKVVYEEKKPAFDLASFHSTYSRLAGVRE